MWPFNKKTKGTYVPESKKITPKENKDKANKSKDKGNNEGVANLKDIKKSRWL